VWEASALGAWLLMCSSRVCPFRDGWVRWSERPESQRFNVENVDIAREIPTTNPNGCLLWERGGL
jgi:hypothetical protein